MPLRAGIGMPPYAKFGSTETRNIYAKLVKEV